MFKGKLIFAALAVIAVTAMLTVPAGAFENEFGGYWRFRGYSQNDFNGENDKRDLQRADSRTRLYYTATFNENFRFVNKFEMDAVYGGGTYGELGSDGINVQVKNTYADFTLFDALNFKVGTQHGKLARGFFFSEDFSGATVTYKGDNYSVPLMWARIYEGYTYTPNLDDPNDGDRDLYAISPVFEVNNIALNPWAAYLTQESSDLDVYVLGADVDMKMDTLSAWLTGIYAGGDYSKDLDMSAYLVAAGANVDMGMVSPHFEAFYASGDDDPNDGDQDAFYFDDILDGGQSYYWSEIMGKGIFDSGYSVNSSHSDLDNIWAANLGVTVNPIEKLSIAFDLWYAELAEEKTFASGETADELGTEVDVTATYEIMDNLSLDMVAAYLFAGDATSLDGQNEEDPYELGTRLSLSF